MFSKMNFGQIAWHKLRAHGLKLLMCSSFAASVQVSANTLEDISFSSLPGDRFEVRMQFSEAPPVPEGYTTDQPARIVIDLPDVENGLSARNFPLSIANAESATVISAGNRTRLVVNLNSAGNYSYRTDGNAIVMEVGQANAVVAAADSSSTDSQTQEPSPAPTANQPVRSVSSSTNQIKGIDFRRGTDGEGRIIVDLSSANVGIDMSESRGAIEITFEGMQIPSNLIRRLDVTDFATPVSFVDAQNNRLGGTIRIEANGYYDYLAYQADNQYVLSVKPLTQREVEKIQAESAYSGDPLNLTFTNIDVNEVLGILADVAGFNLVTTDTVRGTITLRLTRVPWDQALDIVLKAKGLDKRIVGNVMRIAPAAEIAEQERQELETQRQLQELAPLRTEHVRISYANAKNLYNLFMSGAGTDSAGTLLSDRGRAIVDERTNSIIITETAEKIAQFRSLIDQLDIPIRQVQIEARIVIANSEFRKEIGVRWGAAAFGTPNNSITELSGSLDGLDSDPGAPFDVFNNGATLDLDETLMVDLGVANPTGSFAFDIITDNILLAAELSAMQEEGTAEIVSQPKVITGDKQPAIIQNGTQIPYQEASASGATSTSFKDAVLKLEVTPQITPDGNIILDLIINQDSVGDIDVATGIPVIDITQIQNQVLVRDGETVVLGGILQTQQQDGVIKVPFLGDIPYLGRLFKQDITRQQKRELLIFITPRILPDTLSR